MYVPLQAGHNGCDPVAPTELGRVREITGSRSLHSMEQPMTCAVFRSYREADHDQVAALWTRINRELAPADMRDQFEQYIATALAGELRQAQEIFSLERRNDLWVVHIGEEIIGTFGIESRGPKVTELRRMYLAPAFRGQGIAQRMLLSAEERARELGFERIILSTAEVQKAALQFYKKSGYQMTRAETAEAMTTKTVGGGLTRYHFEKII
jgi:GNAT superfamily N-acetyltransferase